MNHDDSGKTQAQLIAEITALRQRIAALEVGALAAQSEASAERLRQVVRNMPVMMLAYDQARLNIVVWNQECERVTGWSAAEIVGDPLAPLKYYPDEAYRRYLYAEWDRLGDDYRELETHMTCKDGSVRVVAWSNISGRFPIPGWGTWAVGVDVTARKAAERVLLNARDELERLVQVRTRELAESNRQLEAEIDERIQAEEAVREREERLRRVLEHMPVMLIAYDEQASTLVVWNRECERVTGWSAAEIVGKTGTEIHPLLYPDKDYLRHVWELMKQGGDRYRNLEWDWMCKDGTRKTISWSNISGEFPIPGWATWAVGIDVTERRKTQQRAMELIVEQQRVQLLQQFIGDISHDLKNPLASMMFSLGVIRRTANEGQRQQHLEIIDTQIRHLEKVLEDLLNIVRLDRDVALSLQFADLNPLAAQIAAQEQGAVAARGQTFAVQTARQPLRVRCDPARLGQALTNLVVNAINYTPEGGAITLRTFSEDGQAVLEVTDTGIGIAPDVAPHIFKRFYRADQARGAHTGGMGLGLAIAQAIVHAHRGTIEVDSAPGEGSTFRIRLPLVEPA